VKVFFILISLLIIDPCFPQSGTKRPTGKSEKKVTEAKAVNYSKDDESSNIPPEELIEFAFTNNPDPEISGKGSISYGKEYTGPIYTLWEGYVEYYLSLSVRPFLFTGTNKGSNDTFLLNWAKQVPVYYNNAAIKESFMLTNFLTNYVKPAIIESNINNLEVMTNNMMNYNIQSISNTLNYNTILYSQGGSSGSD